MSDTVDTADTVPRNTRSRGYCLTWFSYPENWKELITKNCEKFVAQPEETEDGRPHIQGVVYFKNARYFSAVKELFPGARLSITENWNASKNYCRKERSQIGEGIDNTIRRVVDPLEGVVLREWQSEVLERIRLPPDDRSIHWICDRKGNCGKTTLAKHLCLTRSDVIYLSGKCADMKYAVWKWLQKKQLSVAILDFTRSQENYISYQGIEEIKNGIFFNTKYESEMCVYNSPHVLIFANFMPDMDALSLDRWRIYELNDDTNTLDTDGLDLDTEVRDALTPDSAA